MADIRSAYHLPVMTLPWPTLARELLQMAAYNTAIAAFLTALTAYGFATNLSYAQCIGFAVYGSVRGIGLATRQTRPGWLSGALGIPLGFAVGFALASWLNGLDPVRLVDSHPGALLVAGATSLLFGAIGTWHFRDQGRLAEARAEARAEHLRRLEREALATRTELALLQAQIEPHFLFNTLSNVVSLVDSDPPAARRMLLDLTALLRGSLGRTRRPEVTLQEEMDLLRAYLDIMAVRMGDRLRWQIQVDPAVAGARLPPLLVQPLVENAIRHGLEPKPAGGQLALRAQCDDGRLAIEVADGGRGFAGDRQEGLGLANVRNRLRACYGDAASLTLETNPAGGVTARLLLPLGNHDPAPDHR